MWFSKKTEGVISVFLILIMVPTMLFSVVLVEGSRISSAKAITQEAVDMAITSVLSDYNVDLKDEYGLFALQSGKSVKEQFDYYLAATLSAYTDKYDYSQQTYELIKNEILGKSGELSSKFADLYSFELGDSQVTPLYSLANKNVLQSQMIEHAKYRGLYVAAERLEILTQIDKIKEAMEEQEKTADAMEEKMDIDVKNASINEKAAKLATIIESFNGEQKLAMEEKSHFLDCLNSLMREINMGDKEEKTEEDFRDAAQEVILIFSSINRYINDKEIGIVALCEALQRETEEGIKSLEEYIEAHKNDGIEAIDSYIEDAQKSIDEYEKINESAKEILGVIPVSYLKENDIGTKAVEYVNAVWDCVNSPEITMVKGKVQSCLYRFTFGKYNDSSYRARITVYGEIKHAYDDMSNPIGLRDVDDIYVPNGDADSEDGSKKIKESDIKKSGNEANDKAENNSDNKKKLDKELYKSLPSRTFSPDEELGKYGELVDSDAEDQKDVELEKQKFNTGKKKSSIDTIKKSIKSGLDDFAKLLEVGRDEALTFTYILGTFKTRMTGKKFPSYEKLSSSQIEEKYVAKWRLDGESNLRFDKLSENKDTALNAEVEYIIFGFDSDAKNEAAAYASIMGMRFTNNMIALPANPSVRAACHAAAAASSAATWGAVPEPVFYWIYLSAWAAVETGFDMDFLVNDGFKIPFIKTKDNIVTVKGVTQGALSRPAYNKTDIMVSYEDYLILLLMLKKSNTRVMRSGDLIEMNMRKKDEGFRLSEAYTTVRAASDLSIRYLFLQEPVFEEAMGKDYSSAKIKYSNLTYLGY